MTLLAVVGWFAVIVLLAPRIGRRLLAPRIGRRLKATWLPDPRESSHADPGCPSPGSAFDEVRFVFPTWTPYERPADWSPLLDLFKERS